MGDLYALIDIVIALMKQVRFYGISLFDVTLWTLYIGVMWSVVTFAFNALSGGGND